MNKRNKLIHIFSMFTLKSRLLITYICLSSLILLITALSFYSMSKHVLIKNATTTSAQQLSIITSNLNEKLGHISDYAVTLSINSDIAETLKQNPRVPGQALDKFLVNSSLTKQAQRIIGLHKNIYQWDILDTQGNWFHSSTTITEELDSYLTPKFLDYLMENPEYHLLGPVVVKAQPMFYVVKPITDLETTKYLGSVVLLIKESNVSSAFQNLPDSSGKDFFIVNSAGKILSSTNAKGIFQKFGDFAGLSENYLSDFESLNNIRAKIHGVDSLLIKKDYPEMDWQVINVIPIESLNLEHSMILRQILMISCLLFVLSLLFSMLCTKSVTSPIQNLARKMQTASGGNLNITANYYSNDEIAVLYEQFNNMIKKINILMENIYKEQNAKQEMEVKLLQSQVNPHFLYNTLNMIQSFIDLGMPDTAKKAISAMSEFYRLSLSKGNFVISVQQELDLTRQYLYLESLRYMEYTDYRVLVNTSTSLDNIQIPKLTLQPLVENIFLHAFSDTFCHIIVTLDENDYNLIIKVKDNGIGINAEKRAELNAALARRQPDETSFGIPSVHWRIRLLYGPPYGLSINSREHEYTEIIIILPKGENMK